MECPETLELLCDFVDSELEEPRRRQAREHLDACPACMQAYEDLLALKRLVQNKTRQPTLPGGLSARVLRQTRAAAQGEGAPGEEAALPGAIVRFLRTHRRNVTTLAALLLLCLTAFLSYEIFVKPVPLVHGQVVEEIARYYESMHTAPEPMGIEDGDLVALLEEIHAATGVRIDAIPRLGRSKLIHYQKAWLHGRACVRLDYQCLQAPKKTCPKSVISVFALPIYEVELPHRLAADPSSIFPCPCLRGKELTVYCFCTESTSFNLVSSFPGEDILSRLTDGRP